jgi:hypothetical protein
VCCKKAKNNVDEWPVTPSSDIGIAAHRKDVSKSVIGAMVAAIAAVKIKRVTRASETAGGDEWSLGLQPSRRARQVR